VEIKDHIEISTGERVEVERDASGRIVAVYIVPARGPDVGPTVRSASVVAKISPHLAYRGSTGRNRGRRAPRRLPQR